MRQKRFFIAIIATLFSLQSFSQIELGGTCGLGISNNIFSCDVAPELSYRTLEHLKFGVSPFVLYNKDMSYDYWSMVYGGRVYAEYQFDFNVFLHAEYEISNISNSEGWNKTVTALPIGIGGVTDISERMAAYVLILYDVLYDETYAIRTNPTIRAGVRYKF